MKPTISTALILTCAMCLIACTAEPVQGSRSIGEESATLQQSGKWETVFNGQDLTGWIPKVVGSPAGENPGNLFRVENGMLRVSYDQYRGFEGQFGHLFLDRKLSHYRLKLEYRFTGKQLSGGPGWAIRNSGVMIHAQTPESMDIDQAFPVSVESQLLGGLGSDERQTGNVCTPGTHVAIAGQLAKSHCTKSASKTFHGDQWVRFEVEVRGSTVVRHFVNGEQVLEMNDLALDPADELVGTLSAAEREAAANGLESGFISLQAESHNVDFRNIELMLLEP